MHRHRATQGDVWRVIAGRWPVGLSQATSGGRLELIWEQEAAGSNPAIPITFFECAIDCMGQGWQSASASCVSNLGLSCCCHPRRAKRYVIRRSDGRQLASDPLLSVPGRVASAR
jgi:hypothetical protein